MKTRPFSANNGIQWQVMTSVEGKLSLTATPVSTMELHSLFHLNQSSLQRIYTQVVVGTAKQVQLHVIWPINEDTKTDFELTEFCMLQYVLVSHFNCW